MEIAAVIMLIALGVAVGVPFVTMMATDFEHILPPGKGSRRALPPGTPLDVEYEVYDEDTGKYVPVGSSGQGASAGYSPSVPVKRSVSATSDKRRDAKRALALLSASSAPVRKRKDKLVLQTSSFEKCSAGLDVDLKAMFDEASLTYSTYASTVAVAEERFWSNVSVAIEALRRFDSAKYAKLEAELARSERLMFDSFDAGVLASQISEAVSSGAFGEFTADELAALDAQVDEARRLAAGGKQLQAREVLSEAKEMLVSRSREESSAHLEMHEMEQSLADVDVLHAQNEGIIAEMRRLSSELRQAMAGKRAEKTEDVIAEMSRLSDNVHKYEA